MSDTWRVSTKLSLEIGVRYELAQPMYTQANNITNFDPALYDPSTGGHGAAERQRRRRVGGNRYNGLIRAGDGVPDGSAGPRDDSTPRRRR